ncbi:MAG: UvrD-helicase domain-containing protein [Candidatus Omnitrophica bacterium]|nr:UvrD-helicase domain-containing protein [Candidatus Omnitrophota bacterium]
MNSPQPDIPLFPEVVVVEASAGSGKTYCLARRYLQLLINPNLTLGETSFRNILAITFTNKATIEMKERILELLKKIALDDFDDKSSQEEILAGLGVDKQFAQKQALVIMDELIKHYNSFGIQTIDSFINALLLGCAFNIGRSGKFKIKRDYSRHLSYCFDQVIVEAAEDKKVFALFKEFLEHYLFLENRNGWFPKKDILQLMQILFTLSNRYAGAFVAFAVRSEDVIKKKVILFNAVKSLSLEFPCGLNGTAKNAILRFVKEKNQAFKLSDFPDRFKAIDVPMNKGELVPAKFARKWRKVHEQVGEFAALEAAVMYNPYIKLFQKMLGFFQLISKREDLLFLEELNYKARSLFCGGITVAELYYRLATRFSHYLIDEFQDTSILQWKNLEMMIEEALSSGGSLFYVGDKKQAIYRFRAGEFSLFDDVKNKLARYNVKTRILRKNWRSQKAIVEFNNELFSQENLKAALTRMNIQKELEDDTTKAIEEILKVFKDSEQTHKPSSIYGYVYVENLAEGSRKEGESVKDRLFSLINELCERFSYEDIAILCRDNDEVELVTSWLLEKGLPVESEKTLNLGENYLIKEIICFLKFLHFPPDDLNFAAFILGDIFQQASGLSRKEVTDFLFRLHKYRRQKAGISLYHQFRKKYSNAWNQYIDKFFKSVGFISPYELLISIYQSFLVMENFPNTQAFFMKLLEYIKQNEDEYAGLDEFLACWEAAPKEDLYVRVVETNSISVLTIHKSKGLEFGVVITPFLRMEVTPPTASKHENSYLANPRQGSLGLVKITREHRKYSPILGEIYKDAYVKACIDELNNIYVALTRAKFELYIFLPPKSGSRANKARCLFSDNIYQRGQKRLYEEKEAKDEQPPFLIPLSHYQDWVQFLKDEFASPGAIKNREKVIQGNAMHFVLSCIDNLYQQDETVVLAQAIKNAKVKYPNIHNFDSIEKKIKLFLEKEEMKPFFYVTSGQVFREKEVVNNFGQVRRIDRMILTKALVWIVDFKSSAQAREEDIKQIKEYTHIIESIYPKRQVRGSLIYLDELRVEEVGRGGPCARPQEGRRWKEL